MSTESKEKKGALKIALTFLKTLFDEFAKIFTAFCIFAVIGSGFGYGVYKSGAIANVLEEKMIVVSVIDKATLNRSDEEEERVVKTDEHGGEILDDTDADSTPVDHPM